MAFMFAASELAAPPYVAISGLTEEELSVEDCPDGILAAKVPGLAKGGDDIFFNNSVGWLVFLRIDKKSNQGELSTANKKFIHYNDNVLLLFIQEIRKALGWKKGKPVPDCMTVVSWFDGYIGQLQTMIDKAREALDDTEKICCNKHSATSAGTQQPCDLSPVFKLMKQLQKIMNAKRDNACGLAQTINQLFDVYLKEKGLNLAYRKKKALIDFLLCLPELLEAMMKKQHIKKSFVQQA